MDCNLCMKCKGSVQYLKFQLFSAYFHSMKLESIRIISITRLSIIEMQCHLLSLFSGVRFFNFTNYVQAQPFFFALLTKEPIIKPPKLFLKQRPFVRAKPAGESKVS